MRNPDLLEALRAGIIELGFAANFEPNDGIRAERLWEFSPRIVLQSDHKLARSTAVKLRDLNGETLIVHPRRGGNAANGYVMALCRDQEFVPGAISEVPEVADLETLVGLVSCGLGVTILPSAFESMQWPDVVFRPILGATYRATVWAGWRAEHATSLVENFVALARSSCKARE
jgi:DNA-binding transcriptional LysR family regulator